MSKQKLPDSIISHEERHARIKAASAELEKQAAADAARLKERQEAAAKKARAEEDEWVGRQMELIQDGETREHLLQRIRDMRENKPPELNFRSPHITQRMQDQTNLEMEAGRAAVAKAQKRLEETQDLRARVAAQEEAKLGHMQPVYVPTPKADEVFPANKATIK